MLSTTTTPSSLKIGSLIQLNNEVFKIVNSDKSYTQFAGHYTIQSLETGQILKAFKHELVDIATDFLEDSQSDISVRSINRTAKNTG